MTKKKILLFLAVVMLYLTANMSGVAWFTAYDSKELTVTSGVFVKPYLVSGEELTRLPVQ